MSRNSSLKYCAFLLPLSCLGLFSCSKPVHLVASTYAYGTTWELHLYQGQQSDVDEILSYIGETSRLLDLNNASDKHGLYTLNQTGQVDADPFLLEAISLSTRVKEFSQGSYSITIGKLTSSWVEALEKGEVLPQESVDTLLEEAKATSLDIQGNIITKTGSGQIDLGSIGKGLCLNKIKAFLAAKGILKYLINAGSSSYLLGESLSQDGTVKVNLEDAPGTYFYAKNVAISTSSISRQKYVIDGKTYSHIIDARNGSALSHHQSLTMVGEDSGFLDGLTTAFLSLEASDLSSLEAYEVKSILVDAGEVVYESQGLH